MKLLLLLPLGHACLWINLFWKVSSRTKIFTGCCPFSLTPHPSPWPHPANPHFQLLFHICHHRLFHGRFSLVMRLGDQLHASNCFRPLPPPFPSPTPSNLLQCTAFLSYFSLLGGQHLHHCTSLQRFVNHIPLCVPEPPRPPYSTLLSLQYSCSLTQIFFFHFPNLSNPGLYLPKCPLQSCLSFPNHLLGHMHTSSANQTLQTNQISSL